MLRGSKNTIMTSLKAFLYSLYFTHNFAIKDFKALLFFFFCKYISLPLGTKYINQKPV